MHRLTTIFSLICLTLSTGCTTYSPVTLVVADVHDEPVDGAYVHVAPMYFFNPTKSRYLFIGAYDILEPFPGKGDAGVTDLHGHVTLKITDDSPLTLDIYADGFSPWKGRITRTKQGTIQIRRSPTDTDLVVNEFID